MENCYSCGEQKDNEEMICTNCFRDHLLKNTNSFSGKRWLKLNDHKYLEFDEKKGALYLMSSKDNKCLDEYQW